VQEVGRRERRALCGVEVAAHRAAVFVTGRVACRDVTSLDIAAVVRGVYASAGYGPDWPPDPARLRIETDLCLGPLHDGEAEFRAVADDQAVITGYAVDVPGTNYLPPEHWLAWRLSRRLEQLRTQTPELRLGPDGKVAVVIEEAGERLRLASCNVSLQQAGGAPAVELHRAVLRLLREELKEAVWRVHGFDPTVPEEVTVNGGGDFAVGGPEGDNGLSGKKLVVDAYGPRVPVGGGALSGKDFCKADRAGALAARRLARGVVLTGAARACTSTLVFYPGDRQARVVSLRDEQGRPLDTARWAALFDCSLAGIGDRYTGRADLVDVARHGHFTEPERPWEPIHFDSASPPG
jgi:S-adenosylmethionine synthetase